MSYEIVYDKQFIKVKDKFLPFVLAGSNNCTEFSPKGKERRSRSWWLWSPDYSDSIVKPMTKEEMVNACRLNLSNYFNNHKDSGEEYTLENIKKSYGYFTSLAIGSSTVGTSYKTYENVYSIGCDKAITIEELRNEFGSLKIHSTHYGKVKLLELGLEEFSITIENEEHFYEVYNKYIGIYGALLRIDLQIGENTPKRIRKQKKIAVPKIEDKEHHVRVNGYYTIKAPNENYFVKNTKSGYRYSYYPYRNFATEGEANKFAYGKRNCIVVKESGEKFLWVKESILKNLKENLVVSI